MINVLEPAATVSAASPTLEEAALRLARDNVRFEPTISRFYLFPDASQIRLVGVDTLCLPSEVVSPFYFNPAPVNGHPYAIAIALILPEEEVAQIPLPPGWGDWSDARIIWPEA